ncbi:glyoxalase [Glycomyces tritici]|uniref:Glyoxalase n=2 Tax=Glycomyces tritici TaxID=2665176 RepID=A0ABT7YI18_9ACTN|nr:glyoxalase [Glycomyces tritici]MDN3238270.1 glyoxalase [Glycomyces tritici]
MSKTSANIEEHTMNAIETVTLEVDDAAAAEAFYAAAFDLGEDSWLRVRPAKDASSGFRGFAISLVVAQPGTVDSFAETAIAAGATAIKAPEKSLWGYGAVLRDPYGNIWKLATSQKKQTGPVTREVESVNVGIGVADVAATKQYYIDKGLKVAKAFGRKYVEFEAPGDAVSLSLYSRKFAAKTSFVPQEGSGSHRIVFGSGAGTFTDADGFEWEAA